MEGRGIEQGLSKGERQGLTELSVFDLQPLATAQKVNTGDLRSPGLELQRPGP